MTTAIVVGSGPNGLAGALTLARRGVDVTVLEAADRLGGGARTSENTLPGLLHDDCSAVHPLAAASPVLGDPALHAHGLRWRRPEVDLAHPLAAQPAAAMYRDVARTASGLGADGAAWRRLVEPLAADLDALLADTFRPPLHLPRHPALLARFAARAALPATVLARRFATPHARALFAGAAAHAMQPLDRPATSAIGLMLLAAGHRHGWPVPAGGSQVITDALAAALRAEGGVLEVSREVTALSELPRADIVLLDTSPTAAARILGDRLPARIGRAYRRWRYGPAAFKLDIAVEGGIPWPDEATRRAGTVHLGGTADETADAELRVARGEMPERPFVLVGQQYLADPSRSRGDVHPLWAYAHVPHGFPGDASGAIIERIERCAPGFRERILATHARSPEALERDNTNYVGGDIAAGAVSPAQLLARPRLVTPYATGVDGVYLCSAATPPGPGVHGMCGVNAAESALRHAGSL